MARPVRCSRFIWCGVCARIYSWYLAVNFFLMFRLSSAWETSLFSGCPQWARCPVWDQMQGRAIFQWQSQHTPVWHHCLRYRIGKSCIVTSQHTPLWHHHLSTGLGGLALWRHSTYVCGIVVSGAGVGNLALWWSQHTRTRTHAHTHARTHAHKRARAHTHARTHIHTHTRARGITVWGAGLGNSAVSSSHYWVKYNHSMRCWHVVLGYWEILSCRVEFATHTCDLIIWGDGIHFGEEILRGLGRQRSASVCDITSCAVLGSFMVSSLQHLNVVLSLCKIASYGGLGTFAMRRPS